MRLGKLPTNRPRGGFDGVIVDFGDGCDQDTWNNVFGHLTDRADFGAYNVCLTWADGSTTECQVADFTANSPEEVYTVEYREALDDSWDRFSRIQRRPLSELRGIHIH